MSDGPSVQSLLDLSEAARLSGDYRTGAGYARRAAEAAEAQGDIALAAYGLRSLANQLIRLGDGEAPAQSAQRSVELLDRLHDEARVVAFVEMEPALEHDDGTSTEPSEEQPALVTGRGGRRPTSTGG